MIRPRQMLALTGAAALPLLVTPSAAASVTTPPVGPFAHVMYLSVDGMHQSDLVQYVQAHPNSTLASLVARGTEYTHASTTAPSDSFPGILAPFTGATSKTTGVYYDASYDRTLYAPGSNCSGAVGTPVYYDESIDKDAGSAGNVASNTATPARTILGETIDPAQLPHQKVGSQCTPVYPSDFLATNTVFSVASNHGLPTAYADKHPAYQLVNGHGTPSAVNDLFTPEINADVIPATLTVSRGGTATDTVSFPVNSTNTPGTVITNSVEDTTAYDQIKVDALLNQIDGLRSDGSATTPTAGTVPAILGMNFQSVSVGEKLADPAKGCKRSGSTSTCTTAGYQPGGYQAGSLAFTPQMDKALNYVDGALGQLVRELDTRGLAPSTEVILSAKHGQSPVDPTTLNLAGDALSPNVGANATVKMITTDDVGLLWLTDPSQAAGAASSLIANRSADFAATVYQGGTDATVAGAQPLSAQFGNPTPGSLQAARQPDVLVVPQSGVIYSHSNVKVAEHGGFAPTDSEVPLVVDQGAPVLTGTATTSAVPAVAAAPTSGVVDSPVTTTQIAPTILTALGLDPAELQGVQAERTQALPAAGPTASLPEAPAAGLLVGVGAAVLGGGAVFVQLRRSLRLRRRAR